MILSQGFYGLYPADNFMFRVYNSNAGTIIFTNRVVFFFVSHAIFLFRQRSESKSATKICSHFLKSFLNYGHRDKKSPALL